MTNTARKLAGFIHNLREQVQRNGWRQGSYWLAKTLGSLPHSRIEYTVFARSLLTPLPIIEVQQPLTLRLATEADLGRFRGLISPSELRHFSRRLAHGRYCVLALAGERLAAYCWATTQVEFDVDNLRMRLQSGDVYLDDAFTMPAYRNQGIQTAVHLYRLAYMKNLGYQRAILIVADDNVASRRLISKLGYEEVDQLTFRRVLWQRTYDYRSGAF
jgi:ribosomal protein S18 acetylase RimI-like enzyme